MIKREEFFVKVVLPDKKVETDVNKELQDYEIDEPFEITEAMKNQASRFLKWADLLNRAKRVLRALEREYEAWYAKVRMKVEEKLMGVNGKKPTISDISNGVIRFFPKGYSQWNDKLDKAKDNIATLDMVVRATNIKKDMLVSVGQLCSRLIDSGNLVVKDKRITKRRND